MEGGLGRLRIEEGEGCVCFFLIVQHFRRLREMEREMYNTVTIYSIVKGMLRGGYV